MDRHRLLTLAQPVLFAGGPVSPAQMPGVLVWFKADAGLYQDAAKTTPAAADADPVGAWADQSGSGRDATQAVAGNRPTLKLNIQNGLPMLLYDATDDVLATASIAHGIGTGAFYWAVVVKCTGVDSYRAVLSNGAFAPCFYIHATKPDLYFGGDNDGATVLAAGTYLLEAYRDAAGKCSFVVNGVLDATTFNNAANIPNGTANVGASNAAGLESFYGHIGEVVMCAGLPPASKRAGLRKNLNGRWRIY